MTRSDRVATLTAKQRRLIYLRYTSLWLWVFTCGLVAVDGPPLSTFTIGVLVTPLLSGCRLGWREKLIVVAACVVGVAAEVVGIPLIVAVRLVVFAALGVGWGWHLAGRNPVFRFRDRGALSSANDPARVDRETIVT